MSSVITLLKSPLPPLMAGLVALGRHRPSAASCNCGSTFATPGLPASGPRLPP